MAFQAFDLNPMVANGTQEVKVLNELLVAHEKYLPQFAQSITKLKKHGVYPQDQIVQHLLSEGK